MAIDTSIPDFTDKELENLHANAIRLAQSGAVRQKTEAARLLPIIEAERERRVGAKAAEAAAKREAKAAAGPIKRKRKIVVAATAQAKS